MSKHVEAGEGQTERLANLFTASTNPDVVEDAPGVYSSLPSGACTMRCPGSADHDLECLDDEAPADHPAKENVVATPLWSDTTGKRRPSNTSSESSMVASVPAWCST